MYLSEIFKEAPEIKGAPETDIKGICIDSRKAKEGYLFFCLKGLEQDGHRFAGNACDNGAVAVVYSEDIERRDGVVYIKTDDAIRELGRVSDLFNGSPSRELTVFGVTGTNGKTTVASIISFVYSHKVPCGYMGTNGVRYGDVKKASSLTTPDASEVHADLREMLHHGMKAVAMEVSSHGLAMGRVNYVDFDIAIFTNLTYDHLDYHKTMENYFAAKKLLFTNMKKEGTGVLNADDLRFAELARVCSCPFVTYGIRKDADYRARDIEFTALGTKFILVHGGKRYPVKTNLLAEHNVYNLLAAAAAMNMAGMETEEMVPYFEHIPQVDGRMELIDRGQDFTVIVDYAHTPDGFEKIFRFAKYLVKDGAIRAVFGCAGKRDKQKRSVMGKIAAEYCDKIFVTEEDPRDERAADIGAMIMEEIPKGKALFIADRYEAIKEALASAGKGDCVLILGKGDEAYMYRGNRREPWIGDNVAAGEILKSM